MYGNKQKLIAVLVAAALLFSLFTIYIFSANAPSISAKAAVLYEPETSTFLHSKNSNARLPMASTTKIMTAIVALETLALDDIVAIDERAIGTDGSSVYLKQGEAMSVEGLLYSLMLRSANDAAEALAYEISGSIEAFCDLMNEKALALGLTDTNFKNPHGLDADGHYTSAHDLAIIAAYALKNEKFKEISSTYKKEIVTNFESRILVNHNKLLRSYDGCIGVKTGYTEKSGRSLVSAAERGGLSLICVTINAPDDWRDHTKLLNYGFDIAHSTVLLDAGEFSCSIPILSAESTQLKVANVAALKHIYFGSPVEITKEIHLPQYAVAPIEAGDKIGEIIFKSGDKIIARGDIVSMETASYKEDKKPFWKFLTPWRNNGKNTTAKVHF